MSLIKKIDVEKHFAARRALRLGRTGPLSRAGARMEPTAKEKNAPASLQDGARGCLSPSASVIPNRIATDSDGAHVSRAPRSRQT
jgi:hypothetical protein